MELKFLFVNRKLVTALMTTAINRNAVSITIRFYFKLNQGNVYIDLCTDTIGRATCIYKDIDIERDTNIDICMYKSYSYMYMYVYLFIMEANIYVHPQRYIYIHSYINTYINIPRSRLVPR